MEGSNKRKRPLQGSEPKSQGKRERIEDTLEKFDRCKKDVAEKYERSGKAVQEKSGERCTGNQEKFEKGGVIRERSKITVQENYAQSKKDIGTRKQSEAEKLSTRTRDVTSEIEKCGRNEHDLEMEDISSSNPWSSSDEALSDVDAIQEVGEDFDEGGKIFMSDDEFVVMDEVYSDDECVEVSDDSDLEIIGVTHVRDSGDQSVLKKHNKRDNSRTVDRNRSKIRSDRDSSRKSVDHNRSKRQSDRENSRKSEDRNRSKIQSDRDNSRKSVDQNSSKIHSERDNTSKTGSQNTSEIRATQNCSEIQDEGASSKVDQNRSKIQGETNNSTNPVAQNSLKIQSEKDNSKSAVDPNNSKSAADPNNFKNPVDQNSKIQGEEDPSKKQLDLYKIKFLGARKIAKKRKRKGRRRTSSDSEFTESDDAESDVSDTPRDVLNEIGDEMSLDVLPTSIDRMIGSSSRSTKPANILKPSEITKRSDMIQLQKDDPTLNGIRASFKNNEKIATSKYGNGYRFIMKKKGLYRETFHERNPSLQFILPRQCRFDAILWGHYRLDYHLDKKATMQRLRQAFYWPGMNLDVAEFSRSCQACKLDKKEKASKKKLNPSQPNFPQEVDFKLESFVVLGNGLVSSFKRQLEKKVHRKDLNPEEVAKELGTSRYVKKIHLLGEDSRTIEDFLSLDLKSYEPAGIIMDCGAHEVFSGVNPVNVAKTLVTVARKLAEDHNCRIVVQTMMRRESRPARDNAVNIFNKTLTVLCGKYRTELYLHSFQHDGFRLIRQTSDWIWNSTDEYSNDKSGYNVYSKNISTTIRLAYNARKFKDTGEK